MSREETARLNTLWGRLIAEELARCGVDLVCVSPGSRSAPLTAAVARGRMASRVWLDERGAAFHALGHARATGRPAALVCTSGTAVANYLPAVAEAAQDCIPLLVLTADRPPELLDAGANQAIRQQGIFGDYVRWAGALPAPCAAVPARAVCSAIDQAVHRALGPPAGPVHLNCMFREPLEPVAAAPWPDDLPARWREGREPLTAYARVATAPDSAGIDRVTALVQGARRGLVVVGALPSERDRDDAATLCERLGWPVAADVRSGLRLGAGPPGRIAHVDQLLLSPKVRGAFAPDVVLHLGGQPTSRRLAQALAALPEAAVISVQEHPFRHDPEHRVAQRVQAGVGRFCALLAARLGSRDTAEAGAWGTQLRLLSERAGAAIEAAVAAAPLGEIAAARIVSRAIPAGHGLFLGNSMPIRDMEMFADAAGPRIPVAANRGASGIDGVVSTAAGFACGLGRPATLMIGDLSLLHDLTALLHLRSLPQPLVIVALNNGGGGIFHFLPIAAQPALLDPWFTSPHDADLAGVERLFGIPVRRPPDAAAFDAAYREACASGAPALIEVRSDRAANLAAHRAVGAAVVAAVEAS
ncbi:MAG TPA: 2-succinyl-5-enolpyruvyl-6-hydroxy-3-cyclohexene-1-carboxylic-acid synthase [Candidatus Methanoperedens sp.]|nr:2-succinyl-5-enolpyruvyl-6-hydroxy-3-cyclohexene-1-carboxylic-acid synthase [Candidatus Methanoperedens sp.]